MTSKYDHCWTYVQLQRTRRARRGESVRLPGYDDSYAASQRDRDRDLTRRTDAERQLAIRRAMVESSGLPENLVYNLLDDVNQS